MDKWNGCVAVVTGASSGIGKAIAVRLAEEGLRVAALARRLDRLQELSSSFRGKGEVKGYKCDVTKKEEVVETFRRIHKEMGQVRILVNNAGIVPSHQVQELSIEEWRKVMDVNFFGPFECTRQLLETAENSKLTDCIHIININSVARYASFPPELSQVFIYQCSKNNLFTMSRALSTQLSKAKKNVKITSISPGRVDTEILPSSKMDDKIKETLKSMPCLKPEDIVEAVITQLSVPHSVLISEMVVQPTGEIF